MQESIQNVLQRNSFRARILCTGVVIIIANTAFYFYEQRGKNNINTASRYVNPFLFDEGKSGHDRLRLVLYQACLDPFSHLPKPEVSVMPVRTLILVAMNLVNILCNFYLFQYLEDKRKESIGLYHCISSTTSEFNSLILAVVDRSKERKRKNLIPARLGIYSIYVFGFHTMASEVAYNLLTTKVYEYRPIVKPKFNKITHKYK